MEKNLFLKIAYDGTGFSGWQRQPNKRTVQGVLEEAFTAICNVPIKVEGTSRTDAGVHAFCQRATVKGEFRIPIENMKKALNNYLAGTMNKGKKPPDVRVLEIVSAPVGFHARFNAKGKQYRYIIENSQEPSVFKRNYAYYIKERLDTDDMLEAASFLEGTHDFASFQSAGGTPRETTVRTIYSIDIFKENPEQVTIEIKGDGFLYNMVRIIVGTLVEVGIGRIEPHAVEDILKSKERQRAGHTAPPQGLYLKNVYYELPKEESIDG